MIGWRHDAERSKHFRSSPHTFRNVWHVGAFRMAEVASSLCALVTAVVLPVRKHDETFDLLSRPESPDSRLFAHGISPRAWPDPLGRCSCRGSERQNCHLFYLPRSSAATTIYSLFYVIPFRSIPCVKPGRSGSRTGNCLCREIICATIELIQWSVLAPNELRPYSLRRTLRRNIQCPHRNPTSLC